MTKRPTLEEIEQARERLTVEERVHGPIGLRGMRLLATAILVGSMVSYLTSLSLGAGSAIGSMAFGVLPGTVMHIVALVWERRARRD